MFNQQVFGNEKIMKNHKFQHAVGGCSQLMGKRTECEFVACYRQNTTHYDKYLFLGALLIVVSYLLVTTDIFAVLGLALSTGACFGILYNKQLHSKASPTLTKQQTK